MGQTASLSAQQTSLRVKGRSWTARFAPAATLLTATFLLAFPAVRLGLPFGHDAPEHLSWYRCFSAQLWNGDLYPRWLQGMNNGLGSPDLFVYGPLPYYAAAIFRVVTAGPGRETYELGYSIWLSLIVSSAAAYFWLKEMVRHDRLVATAAAIVYLMVPYYLKTDLYTRAALAEFWAFAWMPLILYATARLARGDTLGARILLSCGYALLLATHLFTTLLFTPVALGYAAVLSTPQGRGRALLIQIQGALTGAALSAVYLVPALVYERYIPAARLIEVRPDYRFEQNFLFSGSSNAFLGTVSRFTAWTAAVAVLCYVAVLLGGRERREANWWAVVGTLSVALMLPLSNVIWRTVPLLRLIQFPFRANILLTLATAALSGLALAALRASRNWRSTALVCLAMLMAAGWIVPLVRSMSYQHSWATEAVNVDYLITAWAQWTDPKLVSLRGISGVDAGSRVVAEHGSVTVNKWQPRSIEFQVNSPGPTQVTVRQLYFPGWTASPFNVQPARSTGLISIFVPPGTNTVSLKLVHGWPEVGGLVISLLTACLLAGLTLKQFLLGGYIRR